MGSLPLRERGLKFDVILRVIGSGMSLPLRERGLKLLLPRFFQSPHQVAPLAGAWIEIKFV